MEIRKVHYLKEVVDRHQDAEISSFVARAEKMEDRARNCYEGIQTEMSSAKFVTMMVLDGLFVVELIRRFHDSNSRDGNDYIFKQNRNLMIIARDLLLLENQLPFFVLKRFSEMTTFSDFQIAAIRFFSIMVPELRIQENRGLGPNRDIKHLLHLVHNLCLSSPQESIISVQSSTVEQLDVEMGSPQEPNISVQSSSVPQVERWEKDLVKVSDVL
ncbi:hypothetical protein PTKIN_Ptkin06aG0184900 [Pterospermum kingtungense]